MKVQTPFLLGQLKIGLTCHLKLKSSYAIAKGAVFIEAPLSSKLRQESTYAAVEASLFT